MFTNSKYFLVASTVVCLVGAGFFWQKKANLALPEQSVAAQEQSAASVLQTAESPAQATRADGSLQTASDTTCHEEMNATVRPSARVELDIFANCRPGERLTVHHNGFMFTQTLDDTGKLIVVVPAMTEHAVFMADFTYGQDLATSVSVPDVASYDRIALQWQGNSGFELHALEFGATYGEPGHIWHGTNTMGGAGHVVSLGDTAQVMPRITQIYSLRRDSSLLAGDRVTVSVEAEVTVDNCDRSISAQLVERRDNTLRTRDLLLNMPLCEAVGDFLVLNNLVETLKIATN